MTGFDSKVEEDAYQTAALNSPLGQLATNISTVWPDHADRREAQAAKVDALVEALDDEPDLKWRAACMRWANYARCQLAKAAEQAAKDEAVTRILRTRAAPGGPHDQ